MTFQWSTIHNGVMSERGVSYVFPDYSLLPDPSGSERGRIGLDYHRMATVPADRRLVPVIETLAQLGTQYSGPREYSSDALLTSMWTRIIDEDPERVCRYALPMTDTEDMPVMSMSGPLWALYLLPHSIPGIEDIRATDGSDRAFRRTTTWALAGVPLGDINAWRFLNLSLEYVVNVLDETEVKAGRDITPKEYQVLRQAQSPLARPGFSTPQEVPISLAVHYTSLLDLARKHLSAPNVDDLAEMTLALSGVQPEVIIRALQLNVKMGVLRTLMEAGAADVRTVERVAAGTTPLEWIINAAQARKESRS